MPPARGIPLRCSLALLVPAVFSCSVLEPRPEELTGTFVLSSVNGRPLPATIDSSGVGFGQVVAETLMVESGNQLHRAANFRHARVTQASDETSEMRARLDYRLSDTRIEIGWFQPCSPFALCLANDVGAYSARDGTITLTTNWYGARPQLIFTRVVR